MRRLVALVVLVGVACVPPRVEPLAPPPPPPLEVSPASAAELLALTQQLDGEATYERKLDLEWQLPEAFERAGLINLAFQYAVPLARTLGHPHRREALELMVRTAAARHDELFAPAILATAATGDEALVEETRATIVFFRARQAFRMGQLDACLAATLEAPRHAKTSYLRGLALADERLTGGARVAEAEAVFTALARQPDPAVQPLALLARAQLAVRQRQWAEAAKWFDEAALHPAVRGDALFGRAVCELQQRDFARGLATLQLDAVRALRRPETTVTEAVAWHQAGHPDEAARALERVRDEARVVVAAQGHAQTHDSRRADEVFASLGTLEAELAAVERVATWPAPLKQSFVEPLRRSLDATRSMGAHLEEVEAREHLARAKTALDEADLVALQLALTRRDVVRAIALTEQVLTWLPAQGPATAETLFLLIALRRVEAEVHGVDGDQQTRIDAGRLVERLLAADPTYPRLAEVRTYLVP